MVTDEEVRQALHEWVKKGGPKPTILAKVIAVNEAEYTCTLQDDDDNGTIYHNVRLRPVLDGNESLTILPKVATWALAVRIEEDDERMVIAVGEVDKYRIKIGESSFEITATGIVINGGTLGGLVKVGNLVAKINALESDLNTIKNVFKIWSPVPNDGGAALKAATATWANAAITATTAADVENQKVKQ